GLGGWLIDWVMDATLAGGLLKPELGGATLPVVETYIQIMLGGIENDTGTHLIGILNDATELKTMEANFVQSQKMQAIGQLAGGVAHDFNNLLTAISGHCDLLLLRHDQSAPDYSDLKQIAHNANRAASLVGQLLAFSRKQTLMAQPMDLHETMSDLTHLLNRLVGEKVTLSLDIAPIDKVIWADRRQFEQVIVNLVVNARDAMPDGGPIEIRVETQWVDAEFTRDRAIVSAGDYVVVKVRDEGHGIDPEKLPKIFEPFFTTKRTGEGTGLGLSTAYGIVKQSGGFIFADSEIGRGTCFTLMFPAHAREAVVEPPIPLPRKPQATSPQHGVVLLVEDETPVRAFASRALRLRGYTVLEAEDAESALRILEDRSLQIDVFVTDVIMPGLDGPTWVRQALEDRPQTRVVFVSGYSQENLAENQARVPNSVFLAKPFSLTELTEVVQEQMS
ncbi:MAG: ATP-binding protein, partial [Pseudomonadota bacterium]